MAHDPFSSAVQLCHSAEFGGEQVLDASVIETLQEIGGDEEPDFLAEVIDLFLQDSGARVAELRRAADDGDAQAMARIAHAIKSASANVGAMTLSWSCEDIEAAVREERELELQREATRVSAMFGEVEEALACLKSSLRGEVDPSCDTRLE